ncbi:SMI1/KNR4 family protein [Microtetraspora glauca]|uniref:SMI1/KNR4 family protein n=1 Tax=Microtetraspora glauca TaxID=1996 RepID=A0ABV3GTP7_MICGL
MITSRLVRLALTVAVAAGIAGAVIVLRRRALDRALDRYAPDLAVGPSFPGHRVQPGTHAPDRPAAPGTAGLRAAGPRASSGTGDSAPFPAEPILGRPSAEELRRYARHRPRGAALIEAFAGDRAEGPMADVRRLDGRTRRRARRWAAAALAVCLLALGAQFLENSTFGSSLIVFSTNGPLVGDDACQGDQCAEGPAGLLEYDRSGCATRPNGLFTCLESKPGALDDTAVSRSDPPTFISEGGGQEDHPVPDARGQDDYPVPDAACTPTVGRPRVLPVRPGVTRAVNRQWRRIEKWLRANAPETYRALRRPARARTIAVAEAQMGLRFPDDLRASLLRHNGSGDIGGTGGLELYLYGMYGVKEIRDTWRDLCRQEGTDYTADPRAEWWSGRMIPVGDDQNGEYLLVDSVRRDVAGTFVENGGTFAEGGDWSSYYALLRATADALEVGMPLKGWLVPQVTDGTLVWIDVDDAEDGVTAGATTVKRNR